MVELKALAPSTCAAYVQELKESLPKRLAREQRRNESLCAVVLLVAQVETVGQSWGTPVFTVSLCKTPGGGSDDWTELVTAKPVKARGRCKGKKPSVVSVLSRMAWPKDEEGNKVGHLKHFLRELGLCCERSDERANTFNAHLRSLGHPERVQQKKLPGHCGKRPYVASKRVFRVLYDFV